MPLGARNGLAAVNDERTKTRVFGVARTVEAALMVRLVKKKSPVPSTSVPPEFTVTDGNEPAARLRRWLEFTVMSLPTGAGKAGRAGSGGSATCANETRAPATLANCEMSSAPPEITLPLTTARSLIWTGPTLRMPPECASNPTRVWFGPPLNTPAPAPEGTRTVARSSTMKPLPASRPGVSTTVCVVVEMLPPASIAIQRMTCVPGPICARPPAVTVIGVVSATPLLAMTWPVITDAPQAALTVATPTAIGSLVQIVATTFDGGVSTQPGKASAAFVSVNDSVADPAPGSLAAARDGNR